DSMQSVTRSGTSARSLRRASLGSSSGTARASSTGPFTPHSRALPRSPTRPRGKGVLRAKPVTAQGSQTPSRTKSPHRRPGQRVAAYLRDVRAAVMDWFAKQTESSLNAAPPLKTNQANRAGYLDPNIWAEVEDLDGLPGWQLLLRPAGAHIRRHMGEYDVLVGAMRSRTTTRA